MKEILAIAANHLKRVFRERAALFWIFVGPLLFTTFFGLVFRDSGPRATVVDLWNRDDDPRVARGLAASLKHDGIEVRLVSALNPESWTLEVPPGTSVSMRASKGGSLVLHSPSSEESNAERRISFRALKALMAVYLQANPADLAANVTDEQIAQRFEASRAIRIERADAGIRRRGMTAGFQRSVPAYLVMFVFMNLLVSGAAISEERASGQLRRIFMAPLRRWQIVGGLLLSRVAIGWIQTAYILLLGVFVFKIHWAEHPWVLLGFLTLFALCSASMGMFVGTLFRDPDKCEATAIWSGILLSPLGGLWWPLEVVGDTMRKIGHMIPTGWAMESVNAMLAFGDGFLDVAPFAAALAALTAGMLFLVVRRLKP